MVYAKKSDKKAELIQEFDEGKHRLEDYETVVISYYSELDDDSETVNSWMGPISKYVDSRIQANKEAPKRNIGWFRNNID